MITKSLLKKCLNEKKQAFCALEKDVQDAINDNKAFQQALYCISGEVSWKNDDDEKPMPNYVYRLSPDTPTEPDRHRHFVDAATLARQAGRRTSVTRRNERRKGLVRNGRVAAKIEAVQ